MKSRPAVPRRTFSPPPFGGARAVARAAGFSFAALSVGFSFGGFFFLWMRTSANSSSSPSAAAASAASPSFSASACAAARRAPSALRFASCAFRRVAATPC